jgi:hypothetical protein
MKDYEQIKKQNEANRKAAAISNRKRLKAETVEGIDDLLKVINSIHFDAVEGLQWGGLRISIQDLADLKTHGDTLAKAFKLEGGEV